MEKLKSIDIPCDCGNHGARWRTLDGYRREYLCQECFDMREPKTLVAFRMWQAEGEGEGEEVLIAVFPEIMHNDKLHLSYMHLGQHGGCDLDYIILNSRDATVEEYHDLKYELENDCGYNLDII